VKTKWIFCGVLLLALACARNRFPRAAPQIVSATDGAPARILPGKLPPEERAKRKDEVLRRVRERLNARHAAEETGKTESERLPASEGSKAEGEPRLEAQGRIAPRLERGRQLNLRDQ
jgi:hypothetical protein